MAEGGVSLLCCDMRITIFCKVIDNLGDAGIAWRLARQLGARGHAVCLLIDDRATLQRLQEPVRRQALATTADAPIDIITWRDDDDALAQADADLWLETFACGYGVSVLPALAKRRHAPRLVNIDHLSAEDWVGQYHGLPSPHPATGLHQTYWLPGYGTDSGGLLREPELLLQHRLWRSDAPGQERFLRALGLERQPDELLVTLFCYPDAALQGLLATLYERPSHLLILGPGGDAAVGNILAAPPQSGRRHGACHLHRLPLLHHQDYDRLLGLADFNIVRGEDSWVRAQWAARPLLWQAYVQAEGAHLEKLEAWLQAQPMPESARALHRRFNSGITPDTAAWQEIFAQSSTLAAAAGAWRDHLSQQSDLVSRLLHHLDDA